MENTQFQDNWEELTDEWIKTIDSRESEFIR